MRARRLPRAADAVPHRHRATVRGRVVDARGTPVKDIEVGWVSADGSRERPGEPLEVHSLDRTDARGRYEANLLPPGPCRIVAGRSFFVVWTVALESELPGTRVLRLKQDSVVNAPDIRLPVDPRVLGTLAVRVLDPSGRPVKGASVHCTQQVSPWGDRGGNDRGTDARGRAVLKGVSPGEVMVSADARLPFTSTHLTVWLNPGERRRVTVVMRRARRGAGRRCRVRVVCRDDAGRRLAGCRVHVFGFDAKSHYVERTSGKDGVATLSGRLRDGYENLVHGGAWMLGHEHAQFQGARKPGGGIVRIDAVVRRSVNVLFAVVDAADGSPVRRARFWFEADGGGRSGMGSPMGVIGPDLPLLPRLFRPSTGLPVGRSTVSVSAPGYRAKELQLRVRPRKGFREVRIPLEPAL